MLKGFKNMVVIGKPEYLLVREISRILKLKYVIPNITKFADGELMVQIPFNLRDQEALIIHSTSSPAQENLVLLMFLINAAKAAEAKKITVLIPYFGYGRQDRHTYNYGPVSTELILEMIKVAGAEQAIIVEPHFYERLNEVQGLSMRFIYLSGFFSEFFREQVDVVVAPDAGGQGRARELTKMLGCDWTWVPKNCDHPEEAELPAALSKVKDKRCLILDDIIDTGYTLHRAAQMLVRQGAVSIVAAATHPVLSSGAITLLENSGISRIFITNSIMHLCLPPRFTVLNAAGWLSQEIKRLFHGQFHVQEK